jgi:PAS domain S-box-containing protein
MILNALQVRIPKEILGVNAKQGEKEEDLILLAIEDKTEMKHLQKSLTESEERYRRAFETSRDGLLLVHKKEGSILSSNVSVQELLGYSDKELLTKKLWDIGAIKDFSDFQKTVEKLEIDGVVNYADTPVKTQNGQNIDSEVILVNKAKVIQCNIRDITERKKTEDLLHKERQQLRELFNNLSSGVAVYEAKNNGEDFIFLDLNKAGEAASKIKREEVIGRSILEVFPSVKEIGLLEVLQLVWRTGQPQHHPVTLYSDGRISQWVENYVYKLFSGEIVAVYTDTTEREEDAEKMRKQLHELDVFYKASIGREERILELKNEVAMLKKELNEKK